MIIYSFLFSFFLVGIIIILPILIFKIKSVRKENELVESPIGILLSWFIASVLYGSLIYFILSNQNPSDIFLIFMTVLLVSFFTMYSYFIAPILLLLSKKIKRNDTLESWISINFKLNVKIYIVNTSVRNAYAVGIIPFSRMILLGKPIIDNMLENDIKGILLHELGHTKMKHLLKLFSINFVACIVYAVILFHISPYILGLVKYGIIGAAIKGLFFGLLIWGVSYYQRNMELSADIFAASKIGKLQYISTLKDLYKLVYGKNEDRWKINYPTLQKRIANVFSNTKE